MPGSLGRSQEVIMWMWMDVGHMTSQPGLFFFRQDGCLDVFFFLGGPCSETIVSNYKEEVIATMGIVHLRFSSKS